MELNQTFNDKIEKLYSPEGVSKILLAFDFASKKLNGKFRENGEECIVHSFNIANTLVDFKADEQTVICGFLHDLLDDTDTTEKEISDNFGNEVLDILKGLTKLSMVKKAYYIEPKNAEKLRKMFLAMGGDARVAFVKLADQFDNMKSLEIKDPTIRVRIASVTNDLFVPIAERLGMNLFKKQLEEYCFKYLYPEDYKDVNDFLDEYYKKSERTIEYLHKKISELAKINNVEARVQSRRKSGFSIFKKWQIKGKDNVFDILALRVIVKDIKDCYTMLGAISDTFTPAPGRMKDYIANPKKNLYMSLHTTVYYEEDGKKIPFEVQIRTEEMHSYCEYGLAAHWIYKERGVHSIGTGRALKNLRNELTKSTKLKQVEDNAEQFLENIQKGFYEDEIFVFTPNYDVVELPKDSIPLDFAYSIHSNLGNRCSGAKVNGKMVPLSTPLKTGDMVEIITSSNTRGPSRDWLKIVKSREAVSKIRAYFKKEKRDENSKLGRDILENYAKQNGFTLAQLLDEKDTIEEIQNQFHLQSVDDMFVIVGYGGLTSHQMLGKVVTKLKNLAKEEKKAKRQKAHQKTNGGVLIGGHNDLLKRFAKCCNPVPGDEIVGYVSRGAGVTIHRKDCKALERLEEDRIIDTRWTEDKTGNVYDASFKVIAKNTSGVINAVSTKIAENNIDITYITTEKAKETEDIVLSIGVRIQDRKQLDEIMNKIGALGNVYEVYR